MGKRAKRANARRKAQGKAQGKQPFYPRQAHGTIPIAASPNPDALALMPLTPAKALLIARPSAQHIPARRSRCRQAAAPPVSDDTIIYIGPPAPADHADVGVATAQALPLPQSVEPLVVAAPASSSAATLEPLARDHAVTKPQTDLWGAIHRWLRSAGRLLRAGVTTKAPPTHALQAPRRSLAKGDRPPSRASASPAPSPREQLELIQLRAENRRLREQLARLTPPSAAASVSAPTQPVTSDS